jgi:hypothetical protein
VHYYLTLDLSVLFGTENSNAWPNKEYPERLLCAVRVGPNFILNAQIASINVINTLLAVLVALKKAD